MKTAAVRIISSAISCNASGSVIAFSEDIAESLTIETSTTKKNSSSCAYSSIADIPALTFLYVIIPPIQA